MVDQLTPLDGGEPVERYREKVVDELLGPE